MKKAVKLKRENTAVVKATKNAAVVANDNNPWLQVSAELDKFVGAPFLKFSKQGEYVVGNDIEVVPAGTQCIAHVEATEFGWKKWFNNRVIDTRMGRVADQFIPPQRDELGDTDQSQWELQDDGTRRDPWQFQGSVPLTRLDTQETLNFATGSKGGLNCINRLTKIYGTRIQTHQLAGQLIIELEADRYKHHKYGWIFYPIMREAGWIDADGKPLDD
jgi:hypothetical protein